MNNLDDDMLYYMSFKLDLNDLLNFSIINKNNYKAFDQKFYKYYAIYKYSNEFWIRAYNRPIFYSKPLKNIKMELLRIEHFQRGLDNLNINRWTKKDFYDYWDYDYKRKNKNYSIDYLMNNVLNIL
jgi:hypothetical protein